MLISTRIPNDIVTEYVVSKWASIAIERKFLSNNNSSIVTLGFAEKLGLLAISREYVNVTSTWINFTIRLQLHKALAMLNVR